MTMQIVYYQQSSQSTTIGGYRYFFNGQEGDNEVFGEMANFGYEFRQYDSRLGRWWSVDPKWSEYPEVSPFVFCNGSPIMLMDLKGEEAWEPDKQALANDKEVRYIAQKGDDLHTLAIQTGLDYGYLNSLYGGMTFNEGDSYSFAKIPAVAKMNEFLNNGMNSSDYNCRSFALFVNGIYNTDFTSSPSIISEVFQNVIPVSQAQTGDVITMADSYENFYNSYWTSVENPYKNSKSDFRTYYTENFSTQITHYGVVLLKNPDGNTISWIIEKRGKNPVEISPFPGSQKVDFEGNLFQPYNPTPVQPGQSSFLYRHN